MNPDKTYAKFIEPMAKHIELGRKFDGCDCLVIAKRDNEIIVELCESHANSVKQGSMKYLHVIDTPAYPKEADGITLKEFLERASKVTENYLVAGYEFDFETQDHKIDEELFEFRTATTRLNELEEAWDVFFAILTQLHSKEYDNYAILESGLSTLSKIEKRSQKEVTLRT